MIEALIGSVIALVSAACGWLLSHRWQARHYQLAVDSERARWNTSVEHWSAEVVDAMIRIHAKFEQLSPEEAVKQSRELALALSVLVDRGRLYFPNVMRDRYGDEKQASHQGYRNAILDPLVAAQKIATGEARPEFDVPDVGRRYGSNRCSKAVRLYLNVVLSLLERALLVQSSHQQLINRLRYTGRPEEAEQLRRLLCPEYQKDREPPGHRYWLGQEIGPRIPDESAIFEDR